MFAYPALITSCSVRPLTGHPARGVGGDHPMPCTIIVRLVPPRDSANTPAGGARGHKPTPVPQTPAPAPEPYAFPITTEPTETGVESMATTATTEPKASIVIGAVEEGGV